MAEPETSEIEKLEPVSDRDAVNDAVRDAISSLKGEEPESTPAEAAAEPSESLKAAAERPRAADGKFAKTEAAPDKAAPESTPKLSATEQPTTASAAPSTASAPPVSWAADAKQAWASLPPAIQTAVLKREDEASRGFAQYSEKTKAYERALAPVAQEAQRFGLNVEDGIKRLLDGQRFLETQPAQAILWLAEKHGLNLAEIASNPPAHQTPARADPVVPPEFVQHVSSLEERLNGILMDQNMSAVTQFAEKNTHYQDVEDQLPAIMREIQASNPSIKGVALLQLAYDRAIWLNPDVRSRLISEQQAQTQQTNAAKLAEKSNQARRAAVSIRGSSADTRPPPKAMNGTGSVYDDVRDAIAQHRAG